jgi:outer membrane protein TolC
MYSFVLFVLLASAQSSGLTLSQVEAEALANNLEIRNFEQQVRVAESRVDTATALEDPEFMYRGWGTPLFQPWNINQTQHMFMFNQKIPARGKRELRYLIAEDDTEIRALAVEARKLEILGLVRRAFYQLLRSYDQLQLHHEQVTLAEQAVGAVRVKYTVGKVPQQDVLKAQIAYSRLVEHELMFQREAEMARAELNTLMGRPADQSIEVAGEYRILQQLPSQRQLQASGNRHREQARTSRVESHETPGRPQSPACRERKQPGVLNFRRLHAHALRVDEPERLDGRDIDLPALAQQGYP